MLLNRYFLSIVFKYKISTFSLAQGVLLKNYRLDFIDGFEIKQLILIRAPSSSHPYSDTKYCTISANLTPCSGLFTCSLLIGKLIYG